MDIINVFIGGEEKSGKSTFATVLRLTKINTHKLNITKLSEETMKECDKCDILFCVMDIEKDFDDLAMCRLISSVSKCLVIPVFNKLDLYDFTIDEKTGKVILLDDLFTSIDIKLNKLKNLCDQTTFVNFCKEYVICSAKYAYMYLYMSTLKKNTENTDQNIVSKIGQYEIGKLQWNKKSANEKIVYGISLVEKLKKQTKLNQTLNSVGYANHLIIQKYMSDQQFLLAVQKHLNTFHVTFLNMIKSSENIINVLEYVFNNFKGHGDSDFLSNLNMNISYIVEDINNYINNYDYTSLDFSTKSKVLQIYQHKQTDILFDTNSTIKFLSVMLSQEIILQLESCKTFYELVDKLYESLDINNDIFVDQVLIEHNTFKSLLFTDDLQTHIEYALSKFHMDIKSFFFQIMEKKLKMLLNGNFCDGLLESMLCVQDFLDTNSDLISKCPDLRKYKIQLKGGLYNGKNNLNIETLNKKISNESTLYVEQTFYDLIKKDFESEMMDEKIEYESEYETSDEELNIRNKLEKKHK